MRSWTKCNTSKKRDLEEKGEGYVMPIALLLRAWVESEKEVKKKNIEESDPIILYEYNPKRGSNLLHLNSTTVLK